MIFLANINLAYSPTIDVKSCLSSSFINFFIPEIVYDKDMTAVSKAFDGIRDLIARGELKPGDRLPPESELTKSFGVSRSSLREAMKMLTIIGVLDSPTGYCTKVSNLNAKTIFSGFGLTLDLLPLDSFLEIYMLRRIVETAGTELATANATQTDIECLRQLALKAAEQTDLHASIPYDHLFHRKIAELSGNSAIVEFLEAFRNRSQDYDLYKTDTSHTFKTQSDLGHLQIVQAMERRDATLAASAMTSHIELTYQSLIRYHPDATTSFKSRS